MNHPTRIAVLTGELNAPEITVTIHPDDTGIVFTFADDNHRVLLPWNETRRLVTLDDVSDHASYRWIDDDGAPIIRVTRCNGHDDVFYLIGFRGHPTVLVGATPWDVFVAAVREVIRGKATP